MQRTYIKFCLWYASFYLIIYCFTIDYFNHMHNIYDAQNERFSSVKTNKHNFVLECLRIIIIILVHSRLSRRFYNQLTR